MRSSFIAASTVLALSSLFWAPNGEAQTSAETPLPVSSAEDHYAFPVCIDVSGDQAEYFSYDEIDIKPSVAYAGVRYRDAESQSGPLIIYVQKFLDGLSHIQRDFTFAHECVHLNSGDAVVAYQRYLADSRFGRKDMQDMEDRADCLAAVRMRDEFGYSAEQMSEVYDLIMDVEPRSTEQARWDKIVQCYGEDIPVLQVAVN